MKKIIRAALALLLAVTMLLPAAVTAFSADGDLPFTDVKSKSWYYASVEYVFNNGIMNGMTPTTFEPNTSVTRAMFVTMLGRLWGVEEKVTDAFTDVTVKKGKWYAGYVGWAAENGIVNGYPDKTFHPNESLTREQMAAIISRFIDYTGIIPTKNPDPASFFTDDKKVSKYAVSHVDNMRVLGIIEGNNDGTFDPKGKLTRAQAATVMTRLDKMVKNLAIGDPITPDYKAADGDYILMNAWDLYYSGTALGSSYEGVGVMEDQTVPYLAEDENGLMFYYALRGDNIYGVGLKRRTDPNENVGPHCFSVDTMMDMIDLDEYPFVRFGFSLPEGGSASFIMWSDFRGDKECAYTTGEEADGWQYLIADTTGSGFTPENSFRISLTLNGTGPLRLRYFAAFPDEAAAAAFDPSAHTDQLTDKGGEAVEVRTASDGDLLGAYNAAYAQVDKIKNSKSGYDESDVKGKCYYISSIRGNDKNDGLSPSKPWKTFNNLYKVWDAENNIFTSTVKIGDGVFLERGSVFNLNENGKYDKLMVIPGVIYGAYGTGEKPVLSNRLDIGSASGTWVSTDWPNVWKLDSDYAGMPGNIVFKKDGKESWGIFVIASDPIDPFNGAETKPYGWVSNGEEVFESGGVPFSSPGDLKHNLEYIGDRINGGLWVYCDKGNPGEFYDEINISKDGELVEYLGEYTKTTVPTRVDNMTLQYTGGCALSTYDAENFYVTNCVFDWIGGQYQTRVKDILEDPDADRTVRFGNAVQNWGACNGVFVNDCYFKDVYDAAASTQGYSGNMRNFCSSGCVLDRCDLSYEFFNHGGYPHELVNLFITDNYVINNGIGFCDVRTDRRSAFLYTDYGVNDTVYENIHFENNVNIISTEFGLATSNVAFGQTKGTILRNNTYYMDPNSSFFMSSVYNLRTRSGFSQGLSVHVFYPFTSQYLTFLVRNGAEVGSTFYSVENPARDRIN
ncbi:MAG: S-layer homology domain-containing protein [Clostridia bacterium]|nr:S-layer homology domain-containing protein [Clostridia bacterium]